MVAPLMAIGAGLGGAASLAGILGDRKTNKLSKAALEEQKKITAKQSGIADYLGQLARQAAGTSSDIYDPSGGYTRYNPATGKYEYALGKDQTGIQEASYGEELLRNTQDQALRRRGLNDFERMRGRSSDRADRALLDIDAARRGVGRIDPAAVAGTLTADRTRQLNAGYDDAERAARTLQLRTGSGSLTDSLAGLARDRVRAQAGIGNPQLEALQFAEGMNQGRDQQAYGVYNQFGNEARNFYDAQFAPSQYEQLGRENLQKQMDFDMSKLDLAMGGAAQAGNVMAGAQQGLTGAYDLFNKNRVASPLSKGLTGLSNAAFSAMGPKKA